MQIHRNIYATHKTSDKDIFLGLKEEVIKLCHLLLDMRNLAAEQGNQEDIVKIDLNIAENKQILSMINIELDELSKMENGNRMGLFDTFWAA